jgi:23S rRNA (uracil-5-)-methyltransferase RumA
LGKRNRLFKKGQQLEIRIKDIAFGGKGIGKIPTDDGEMAAFVQNSLPGQLVRAKVVKSKRRYIECKTMEVLEHSAQEVETEFQTIPGAPYASLPLALQEDFKKRTTLELYRRIGHIENVDDLFEEYIESPQPWHYRNKMEYSFSEIRHDLETGKEADDFGLGFKHRGTWWKVENLDADSGLFDEEFENKLHEIREFLRATGLPAWHPPKREGFFRYLVVRKSFSADQLLVNLVTSAVGLDEFDTDAFAEKMKDLFGDRLAGIIHTVNTHVGDRVEPNEGNTSVLLGKPKIIEKLNGLEFEISMTSFFQTNPKCAEKLYSKVIEYADEKGGSNKYLMDLFCGTGTIGQLLAKSTGRKVIGVDIVESAIEDAKANAARNGVENLEFHAADVGKFLKEFPEYNGKISTIVIDPPRAGIAPKSLQKVIEIDADRIVYVSCNPATQARDAEELIKAGYEFKKFSLVDQFPHTSHIEAIGVFEKR